MCCKALAIAGPAVQLAQYSMCVLRWLLQDIVGICTLEVACFAGGRRGRLNNLNEPSTHWLPACCVTCRRPAWPWQTSPCFPSPALAARLLHSTAAWRNRLAAANPPSVVPAPFTCLWWWNKGVPQGGCPSALAQTTMAAPSCLFEGFLRAGLRSMARTPGPARPSPPRWTVAD